MAVEPDLSAEDQLALERAWEAIEKDQPPEQPDQQTPFERLGESAAKSFDFSRRENYP